MVSKDEWDALHKRLSELENKQVKKPKKPGKSNSRISDGFKEHLQIFFDKAPDIDNIVLAFAYRSDDYPCDIYTDNVDIWDLNKIQYEALVDATDDEYAEDWYDIFANFVKKEIKGFTHTHPAVKSLDPGHNVALVITNKFKFEERDIDWG